MSLSRADLPEYLRDRLYQCGATWAWLREPEIVARDFANGPEVDLWCDYDAFPSFIVGLVAAGWTPTSGRFLGTPSADWFSASIILRSPFEHLPDLDIHTGDLRWRLVPLVDVAAVRESRNANGSDWYLTGYPLAWVVIARPFLGSFLSGQRLTRARKLWDTMSSHEKVRFMDDFHGLAGTHAYRTLVQLLGSGRQSAVKSRIYLIIAGLRRRAFIRHGFGIVLKRLRPKLLSTPVRCTFIGTDGTGKSTQVALVQARLRARGISASTHYWGRTRGNSSWVHSLRQLSTWVLGVGPDGYAIAHSTAGNRNGTQRVRRLILSIGSILYLIDYWLRYLCVRTRPKSSRVLLFDRGAFDLAVMRGVWGWLGRIYRFAPRSDLVVFCDAPVSTICARKQERCNEEIIFQQNVYRKITQKRLFFGGALTLDVTQPPALLADHVEAAVRLHACNSTGSLDRALLKILMDALQSRLARAR